MSEKKIVLEYTGGRATSVISKWLEVEQGYEVIAAYYNYGQQVDLAEMKKKALLSGAKKFCIIDLDKTNINMECRESIQRELTQLAEIEGANYVAFTQTNAGTNMNDFMMEVAPKLQVVEPFETCWVKSEEDQVEYLKKHHVPVGIGQREHELRNDFAAFCDWHKRRDVYGTRY
jgi:argininosuccinate synthase